MASDATNRNSNILNNPNAVSVSMISKGQQPQMFHSPQMFRTSDSSLMHSKMQAQNQLTFQQIGVPQQQSSNFITLSQLHNLNGAVILTGNENQVELMKHLNNATIVPSTINFENGNFQLTQMNNFNQQPVAFQTRNLNSQVQGNFQLSSNQQMQSYPQLSNVITLNGLNFVTPQGLGHQSGAQIITLPIQQQQQQQQQQQAHQLVQSEERQEVKYVSNDHGSLQDSKNKIILFQESGPVLNVQSGPESNQMPANSNAGEINMRQSQKHLSQSVKVDSFGRKMFTCSICQTGFLRRQQLQRHINACHSNCAKPGGETNISSSVVRQDYGILTIENPSCHKQMASNDIKIFEIKDSPQQQCLQPQDLNQIKANQSDDVNTNFLILKPDMNTTYCCTACDLQFQSKTALSKHRRREHPGVRFPRLLKMPLVSRQNIQFSLAPVVTTSPGGSSANFMCPVCPKRFPNRYGLRRHTRTHTGERPHDCDICGMSFMERSHQKQHRLTHTGETPYHCEFCKRGFSRKFSYQRHLLWHAKSTMEPAALSQQDLQALQARAALPCLSSSNTNTTSLGQSTRGRPGRKKAFPGGNTRQCVRKSGSMTARQGVGGDTCTGDVGSANNNSIAEVLDSVVSGGCGGAAVQPPPPPQQQQQQQLPQHQQQQESGNQLIQSVQYATILPDGSLQILGSPPAGLTLQPLIFNGLLPQGATLVPASDPNCPN